MTTSEKRGFINRFYTASSVAKRQPILRDTTNPQNGAVVSSRYDVPDGIILSTTSALGEGDADETGLVEVVASGSISIGDYVVIDTSTVTKVKALTGITSTDIGNIFILGKAVTAASADGDFLVIDQTFKGFIKTLSTIHVANATIGATANVILTVPYDCVLVSVSLLVSTTVAANDTNYWTFSAINKETGGGSTALFASSDANTTKATGGSAVTAYTKRAMTLHGTAANLNLEGGDVIAFTATKTASGADLVEPCLVVVVREVFTPH